MTQADRRRRREIRRQLNPWPPRRIVAWSLFVLAIVIAVQHVLAHGGWRPIPLSMGWQDILIGYPMAGVVAFIGAMLLDPRPAKRAGKR